MKRSVLLQLKKIWVAKGHPLVKIKSRLSSQKRISNYDLFFEALLGKSGIEIGGPSPIFKDNKILPIYKIINSLDGCNFSTNSVWEGKISRGNNFFYHELKPKGFQYIAEATNLSEIEDSKYDFLLSSNCLEHVANPLLAMSDWVRVVKNKGYLLIILPNKERTFDHNRPVTSFEHIINDYKNGTKEDDKTHLEEILIFHDLGMDIEAGSFEKFFKRSADNFNNRCLHHHVFDIELVRKMLNYFNLEILSLAEVLPSHIISLSRKKDGQ
jgi:SAM-dependent methyltransferase